MALIKPEKLKQILTKDCLETEEGERIIEKYLKSTSQQKGQRPYLATYYEAFIEVITPLGIQESGLIAKNIKEGIYKAWPFSKSLYQKRTMICLFRMSMIMDPIASKSDYFPMNIGNYKIDLILKVNI